MNGFQKVYSGKSGCMCGCRGRYWAKDEKGFERVLKNLLKLNTQDDDGIVWAEANGRIYAAYREV